MTQEESDTRFLAESILQKVASQKQHLKCWRYDANESDRYRVLVYFATLPNNSTVDELYHLMWSRKAYQYPLIEADVEGATFTFLVFETSNTQAEARVLAENYNTLALDDKGNVI